MGSADLVPLWQAARQRLDRFGPDRRGQVPLPDNLTDGAAHALRSLLERNRLPQRLHLAEIEAALGRIGLGPDLDAALTALGFPPSPDARDRLDQRLRVQSTRRSLDQEVSRWPESWASSWLDELLAGGSLAGLATDDAIGVARDVRRVLDALDNRPLIRSLIHDNSGLASRSDLATALFGSAHALDNDQLRHRATVRALAHRHQIDSDDSGEVWKRAGFHLDSVSAPVLTWGLDLAPPSPLAQLAAAATAAGVPIHLSNFALSRHPARIATSGAAVLLVENPRVVEAAAELRVPWGVIATGGNPTTAPMNLVRRLLASGAVVRYHGDFDHPGIGICRRMADLGCTPWMMSGDEYAAACRLAASAGLDLPVADGPCGPTPWDDSLRSRFDEHRLVVHEELVLRRLLDPARWRC